ncbi:hypothetical protein BJF81_08160 [Ornithinimicrobium sp. CNJ-824]|nr:hypothetical protein BJF81_08160 [Ornithinimicrobium sp. CNJ-824]
MQGTGLVGHLRQVLPDLPVVLDPVALQRAHLRLDPVQRRAQRAQLGRRLAVFLDRPGQDADPVAQPVPLGLEAGTVRSPGREPQGAPQGQSQAQSTQGEEEHVPPLRFHDVHCASRVGQTRPWLLSAPRPSSRTSASWSMTTTCCRRPGAHLARRVEEAVAGTRGDGSRSVGG